MERTMDKNVKYSNPDYADLNSSVIYKNLKSGDILKAKIVLYSMADSTKNYYSILSPLGAALIGEKVGSITTYIASEGEIELKILEIQHPVYGVESLCQRP